MRKPLACILAVGGGHPLNNTRKNFMTDVVLSNMQGKCVKAISEWFKQTIPGNEDQFYMGGFAGTGKSTVLPDIISNCNIDIKDVAFCAPTGKAAKVMTKKLREQFPGVEAAKTVHSLIMKPGQAKAEKLEKILDSLRTVFTKQSQDANWLTTQECAKMRVEIEMVQKELDSAYRETDKPNFHLNVESTVREKSLIVVDEASMVGNIMACDLARFGVPILAIGDPFQLPPVGDIAGLTAGEPDFFLTEIHRQALDNPIIWLTKQIREGIEPNYGTFGGVVHVVKAPNDQWTQDMNYDAQVLCGTHKKKWILTAKIRKAMGFDSTGPMADERLLVCKNSRDIPELVNGTFVWNLKDHGDLADKQVTMALDVEDEDTGFTHKVRAIQGLFEEHQMRQRNAHTGSSQAVFHAKMKQEHLDFGHCITVHKSQGSEWDNVIVHDESGVFREDSKRWLYTATSRAKDELILVRK